METRIIPDASRDGEVNMAMTTLTTYYDTKDGEAKATRHTASSSQ